MKGYLLLEDGHLFTGQSIGSQREVICEIVFNTSMTGYVELLTDPSYAGQGVVMTYPLIGNYGVCFEEQESRRPWVSAFLMRELSRIPSNFRSQGSLGDYLKEADIPGLQGIDTRALTKLLRDKGTMNGLLTTDENFNREEALERIAAISIRGWYSAPPAKRWSITVRAALKRWRCWILAARAASSSAWCGAAAR